ncbi:MAG: DNA-binding protein [Acidimicrobiaceae bacterium]|nr:DNA-binding protein [Acidimicrobiaceae bacterium]MXZ98657.1 DNA-binding protein [Acidimicrobiaceae bacterium]MYE77161.1 DNA-binding protein [Acidimicrobiaceae bacterium]MYE97330.1 DNA-binding protein [Acidimicrobiaceae bacterium]MYH44045.1 DNA-binding protein [Acidimicrobiaceae bacterium]
MPQHGEHHLDAGERRLYATWRNPEGLIRPVGVLTRFASDDGEHYRFVYLKAAEQFDGFRCLPGLPDLHRVYESEWLFPVFRNRLMPRSRPDYSDFVSELALDVETDPFEVLIRSEGWRATDRIEVFAYPERTGDGALTTLFFVRGIRHLEGAAEAVAEVRPGDVLELEDEPGNPVNSRAILVSTRTGRRVGWVPDCLLETVHQLRESSESVVVTAEHVNSETSPPHMRLLCRLRAPWPEGYEPLAGPEYQPIAA